MKDKDYNKGMESILKDYLAVYQTTRQLQHPTSDRDIHDHKMTFTEVAFYPDHEPRKATNAYRKMHKRLVKQEDRPCAICGVKQSTLKDTKENPYRASQLETHHTIVEWALMNAIDPVKFNALIRPRLLKEHSHRDLYKQDMTEEEIKDWIDHDEDNIMVLCDVHHRSLYFGVHKVTHPIWSPANLFKEDFESHILSEIAKLKTEEKE